MGSVVVQCSAEAVLAFLSFLPSLIISGTLGVPLVSLTGLGLLASAAFSICLSLHIP